MTTPSDDSATVSDLRQQVADFVAERHWQKYHTPKNLSMSLAIEAAEVMEHFQWLTPEEAAAVTGDPDQLSDVADELADCLAYILSLSTALGIDLSSAVTAKLAKNATKYPADQYRGRFKLD